MVTDEQLDAAHIITANIVIEYGEKYLPVFKRIHEEVRERKAQKDLLAIAADLIR